MADAVYDPLAWLDKYKKKNKGMVSSGVGGVVSTSKKAKPLPGDDNGDDGNGNGNGSGSGNGSGGSYSGSYSGSSGGGGGGSASAGLDAFIQEYRLKFFPGAKPPPDLLKKAKAGNWSMAYFDQQVRLRDPNYYKSLEAKTILPQFNDTMKVLFPGLANRETQKKLMKSAFYKQIALWYLRNGIGLTQNGEELLYDRIVRTTRWKKANPYYSAYAKNKNVAVAAEANPLAYKTYLDAMKQTFAEGGITDLPDDYYAQFFQSKYASREGIQSLQQNVKALAQQGSSMAWFQGANVSKEQTKQATLGEGQEAEDLRTRLARAFGVRGSFLGSEEKGFGTTTSESGKLIRPLI